MSKYRVTVFYDGGEGATTDVRVTVERGGSVADVVKEFTQRAFTQGYLTFDFSDEDPKFLNAVSIPWGRIYEIRVFAE